MPHFAKWSQGYPVTVNHFQLRTKEWVELVPLGPGDADVDAISKFFFTAKGRMKALVFQPNKVMVLYLELDYEIHNKILNYLEDKASEAVCDAFADLSDMLSTHNIETD